MPSTKEVQEPVGRVPASTQETPEAELLLGVPGGGPEGQGQDEYGAGAGKQKSAESFHLRSFRHIFALDRSPERGWKKNEPTRAIWTTSEPQRLP